ncbi:MAG: thiamine-phosphate kinase [Flavobacteriales bacterium]
MSEKRTEISELGEFGLIRHLTKTIALHHPATVKGVGDDAAIIQPPAGEHMVISTDMLVEGVHFDLMYAPLRHLGYKSIVVNLSDICAMNAIPAQVTVSLAISNRFSLEAIEELYTGMRKACDWYGVDLVGGDTTSSLSGLVISVTALGFAPPDRIVTRSGARENDLIVVSGDLGAAYLGLQVLEREKAVFKSAPAAQPELGGYEYLLERQLKPEARKDVVELLCALKVVPTAMIDISDGLASEVKHLCTQSLTGCDIYEEKIPVDPKSIAAAAEFGMDHVTCALNGGEDYELLFTIRQSDYDAIKGNPNFTVIGHITEAATGCRLITRGGGIAELKAQGWDSFPQDEE